MTSVCSNSLARGSPPTETQWRVGSGAFCSIRSIWQRRRPLLLLPYLASKNPNFPAQDVPHTSEDPHFLFPARRLGHPRAAVPSPGPKASEAMGPSAAWRPRAPASEPCHHPKVIRSNSSNNVNRNSSNKSDSNSTNMNSTDIHRALI